MKILSVSLENFASYKKLDFDFQNQGLTLIQGANGSGKSTLCDLIPWCLFGKTAKGGIADEVLSWPGTEVTKVTLQLENVTIVRSRGPKAKDNDLYYHEYKDLQFCPEIRGKDLLDTQKLINTLLNIDYDLYLAGSYYHEFSQTAQFFTAKAKERRTICEQLVDLSLPIKLQTEGQLLRKIHQKTSQEIKNKINELDSNLALLNRVQAAEDTKAQKWEVEHQFIWDQVSKSYENFELKRDIVISNKCNSCGTKLAEPKHIHNDEVNPFLDRLLSLEAAVNPHTGTAKDYTAEIEAKQIEYAYEQCEYAGIQTILGDLDVLDQIIQDLRSTKIISAINYIETETNKHLTDNFDAEIRVQFDVASADKLDVTIYKDGNQCSYTQLSKGQRCLLKLCFGVSVMSAVQNHHGISLNCLWFDEALDGLSDAFKIKAYRLFETISLQYENIFVVEHSEALKACFQNIYTAELTNGVSTLAKTT
jgi:DNA repair exonuclease SbcCD ATPase subunit